MAQAENPRSNTSRVLRQEHMPQRVVEGTTIRVSQFASNFDDQNVAALTTASHHAGDRGPEHVHPFLDEIFIPISGMGNVYINGEPHEIERGDVVVVHAGDRHYLKGISTLTPFDVFCVLVLPHPVCDCNKVVHTCGHKKPDGPWTVKV